MKMKDSKIYQNLQLNTSSISAHIKIDEYSEVKNQQVALRKHSNGIYYHYHSHNYFEINYVLKGSCTNLLEDNVYEMKQGDFLIMHPDVSHLLVSHENSTAINILIDADWFKKTFQRDIFFTENSFYKFIKKADTTNFYKFAMLDSKNASTKYNSILKKIFVTSKISSSEKYLLLESYTIELICALCKENDLAISLSPTRGSEKDIAGSIRAYIFEKISSVTLSKLSEVFGYTTPHICRN